VEGCRGAHQLEEKEEGMGKVVVEDEEEEEEEEEERQCQAGATEQRASQSCRIKKQKYRFKLNRFSPAPPSPNGILSRFVSRIY
jgi:hypothetical protein